MSHQHLKFRFHKILILGYSCNIGRHFFFIPLVQLFYPFVLFVFISYLVLYQAKNELLNSYMFRICNVVRRRAELIKHHPPSQKNLMRKHKRTWEHYFIV